MEKVVKEIGAGIRAERLKQGISLSGLAISAGIATSTLCDIEMGRSNPSINTLIKVSEVLHKTNSFF